MTLLTQKQKPKTKNFFIAESQTLRVWTTLQCNLLRSYAVGKTTEICLILGRFPSTMYLCTGNQDVKILIVLVIDVPQVEWKMI